MSGPPGQRASGPHPRLPGLLACALAALLPASGCGKNTAGPTMLVVEVDSNLAAGTEIDQVTLTVMRSNDKRSDTPFAVGGGRNPLPVRLGLLPADGAGADSEQLRITATGNLRGGKVTEQQATVNFVPNRKLLLKMFLARECRGDPCAGDASRTCGPGGQCIPRARGDLPAFNPDAPRGDAAPPADGPRPPDGPAADVPPGPDGPLPPDGPSPDGPPPPDGGCTCTSDDNPCTDEVCEGSGCRSRNRAERSDCPGGLCLAGVCCIGCVDGQGRCRQGDSVMACGSRARDCQICNDNKECTQDRCEDGSCRADPQSGNSCSTGVCVNGVCQCGGQGEVCCAGGAPCMGGQSCQNGTCGACGAENKPCCPGGACATGFFCDMATGSCQRCGELGQPCCGNNVCRAGVCSGNRICESCGGPSQPCCPTGDACQPSLTCAGGTCRCGAVGQPCCNGSLCAADQDMCNGAETCLQGMCVRTAPVTCQALDMCHNIGACDPATGRCSDPPKPNNTPCIIVGQCSMSTCQNGQCTTSGPSGCNDNNPCTQDICGTAGCVNTPINAGMACTNDNNACTSDVCDNAGKCLHNPIREGQSCTTITGQAGNCQSGYCCPGTIPPPQGPACI